MAKQNKFAQKKLAQAKTAAQAGDSTAAIKHLQVLIKKQPNNTDALLILGAMFANTGRTDSAIKYYKKTLSLVPTHTFAAYNLAQIYLAESETDKAISYYQKSLLADPNSLLSLIGLARCHEKKSNPEEAQAILNKLSANAITDIQARVDICLLNASLVGKTTDLEESIAMLNDLLSKEKYNLSARQQLKLNFSLGRLYDKKSDYALAFSAYEQANKLKQHNPFNTNAYSNTIDEFIRVYSKESFSQLARSSINDESPVFILGLPRSGTSLVEQILASHSKIYGAGELSTIGGLARNVARLAQSSSTYPLAALELTENTCNLMAQQYLKETKTLSGEGAVRVTDKMPGNFHHIGLIAQLFPKARIIHCLREPLDTCISIYFQDLDGIHDYAYGLKDIGNFYNQYERLMQHWENVVDLKFMSIHYEDLVNKQEEYSRQLVEFCGLDWEDQCLQFFKNDRTVLTASYNQVNKPIYKSSVKRWENYSPYIDDLIKTVQR